MELYRGMPIHDFMAWQGATNKPTMCLKINRYANYVPIPKQVRCTLYQGLGEPRITGPGSENSNDQPWNQQDGTIPEETRRRFPGGPAAYEQSHDVS